jgi:hypothetical protein
MQSTKTELTFPRAPSALRPTLFALLLSFGLAGCGGGDLCGPSVCPNDRMRTPAEVNQCRQLLDANRNAACFREMASLGQCEQSSIICSSEGTTDFGLSSTKAINNCKPQIDAANACCQANRSSTVCP